MKKYSLNKFTDWFYFLFILIFTQFFNFISSTFFFNQKLESSFYIKKKRNKNFKKTDNSLREFFTKNFYLFGVFLK